MRVLCCYTDLHPDTARALSRYAPQAEFAGVSGDQFAYWHQIRARWDGADDLVVVEHDVEIHAGVIDGFAGCDQPWCVFPYVIGPHGELCEVGLGCTRFSAALQQQVTVDEVTRRVGEYPWSHVDDRISGLLIDLGISNHIHHPPVTHHHVYQELALPPMSVRRWALREARARAPECH